MLRILRGIGRISLPLPNNHAHTLCGAKEKFHAEAAALPHKYSNPPSPSEGSSVVIGQLGNTTILNLRIVREFP